MRRSNSLNSKLKPGDLVLLDIALWYNGLSLADFYNPEIVIMRPTDVGIILELNKKRKELAYVCSRSGTGWIYLNRLILF
jgi:hypothetical protein